MAFFGLKLGLDLEMRAAHHHQKFQGVLPRALCFNQVVTESLFQLDSIFCLHSILDYAFETNSFRRHETLQNGEKSLNKKLNKARPKQDENRLISS